MVSAQQQMWIEGPLTWHLVKVNFIELGGIEFNSIPPMLYYKENM